MAMTILSRRAATAGVFLTFALAAIRVSALDTSTCQAELLPGRGARLGWHRHVTSEIAVALPNVMSVARSGDFEAVLSHGIGPAKRSPSHVFTLTRPTRVVIDIGTSFPTVLNRVYFFNDPRFAVGKEPFVTSVLRPVARHSRDRPDGPAVRRTHGSRVRERTSAPAVQGDRLRPPLDRRPGRPGKARRRLFHRRRDREHCQ